METIIGALEAQLSLTVYFSDREPAGPYRLTVGARRTLHVRLNELREPEPIPAGAEQAANALMTTMAFPA